MSLEFFNLILWIPFLLVFAGIGISFSLKGFKKGLFHALISVAATICAIIVSYFAAKFAASFAVSGVLSLLPDFSQNENGAVASILPMVMDGVVTGLLSLIIFSVLLAILVPVSKLLFAFIPTPRAKGLISRVLGLALRFAESVVLTILLLLPIYGTLGAYAPAVELATELTAAQESAEVSSEPSIQEFARCAAEHPVVSLAKTPPFTALYNGLSGGGAINVPEAIQTITATANAFQAMASGDFSGVDWNALANMKTDLLSADWFYSVFSSVAKTLEASLGEMGENAPAYLRALQELMALPKESFAQCSAGLLDWMSFASQKGMFQAVENGTLTNDWVNQNGILEKAAEIQQNLPSNFPLLDLVNQFISDSTT